jgi:hypothetical protein
VGAKLEIPIEWETKEHNEGAEEGREEERGGIGTGGDGGGVHKLQDNKHRQVEKNDGNDERSGMRGGRHERAGMKEGKKTD